MKKFINYYQEELTKLRRKGGEFAKKHPDIAKQIEFKDGISSDPHTERIIESMAYMAADLHKIIDTNSNNIAYYLLSSIYPNVIGTLPPCTIITMEHPKKREQKDVIHISSNTEIIATSKDDNSIQFKTLYNLNIYPIEITSINLTKNHAKLCADSVWSIEIALEDYSGSGFKNLKCDDLLMFINCNVMEDALLVYESIFSNKLDAYIKIDDQVILLPKENIHQCGFNDGSAICPISEYSNNAFQLFQEVIHFKQKFMFFRITNISSILSKFIINGKDNKISLILFVNFHNDNIFSCINNNTFVLNSVPIVNLFEIKTDPFVLDGGHNKYTLVANRSRTDIVIQDIISINMIDSSTQDDLPIHPYFSLRNTLHTSNINNFYWTSSKSGDETFISIVDVNMDVSKTYDNVIYGHARCYNKFTDRDIPVQTELSMSGVVNGGYIPKTICPVTQPISCSEENNSMWMLVSQLAATNISISDGDKMLQSITKLTKIFSCGFVAKYDALMNNISDIKIHKIVKRFGSEAWRGFVRGSKVNIYITDDSLSYFAYIFGCVINNYLSTFVSINSFVELSIISSKSEKTLAKWPATSGRKQLI